MEGPTDTRVISRKGFVKNAIVTDWIIWWQAIVAEVVDGCGNDGEGC